MISMKLFSKLATGENFLTPTLGAGLAGLKTMPNERFGPGPKGARKGLQNGAKMEPELSPKGAPKVSLFGDPKQ